MKSYISKGFKSFLTKNGAQAETQLISDALDYYYTNLFIPDRLPDSVKYGSYYDLLQLGQYRNKQITDLYNKDSKYKLDLERVLVAFGRQDVIGYNNV